VPPPQAAATITAAARIVVADPNCRIRAIGVLDFIVCSLSGVEEVSFPERPFNRYGQNRAEVAKFVEPRNPRRDDGPH
jgi:hypothetical protein